MNENTAPHALRAGRLNLLKSTLGELQNIHDHGKQQYKDEAYGVNDRLYFARHGLAENPLN